MSEKEKAALEKLMKSAKKLPEAGKDKLATFAEGMAAMATVRGEDAKDAEG